MGIKGSWQRRPTISPERVAQFIPDFMQQSIEKDRFDIAKEIIDIAINKYLYHCNSYTINLYSGQAQERKLKASGNQ